MFKSGEPKLIAIIAGNVTEGIDWAKSTLNIKEYNVMKRRVVDQAGNIYMIVTKAEHIRGMQFKDFKIVPGASHSKEYHEMWLELSQILR